MSNKFSYLTDEKEAVKFLAQKLNDGTLILFLGAGTSKGFGLPDWNELVNELRIDVGLPPLADGVDSGDLQSAIDDIEDRLTTDELKLAISKVLYKDFNNLSLENVLNHHLLVAVSALLMGSKRGRVTRVVTLNYDSMLEWFLGIFGFVVKTVYKLPFLEGAEDVRIFHPHGYIPLPILEGPTHTSSDKIILSRASADRRIGLANDEWFELTRHLLNTGVCLFLGMSENTLTDVALSPLFQTVGDKCNGKRPLGIWVLKADQPKKIENFFRRQIIPVCLDDYSKMPGFLLSICQESLANVNE